MNIFYDENKEFKLYVDQYCVKHHCSLEKALQDGIVLMVAYGYGYRPKK